MKKIINSIFIFLSLFVVMFICENVYAINITSESTGIYFTFMKDNGHRFSDEMMIYKIDGEYAYCIEPGVSLGSTDYYKSDLSYLDDNTRKKIEDYMYYGYKFNREGWDYYIATQALIWETLLSNRPVTFSTELFEKGTIKDYTFYKNQIITGVRVMNNNFDTNNIYNMYVGDDLLIENLNLNNYYDISYDNNIFNVRLRSQSINITNANTIGTYEINLIEKDMYNHPYIVYRNNNKQDLLVLGNIPHRNRQLIINVKGGSLTLNKEDYDTHELLANATYRLYDNNDNLLYELTTNEYGSVSLNEILNNGTYYLKELVAPITYDTDDNKYFFTIDSNNRVINITMSDYKIEGNLTIIKKDIDTNEVISDTDFIIMDEDNNIIDTITTDNKGEASIKLKYGKYKYQEVKANPDYELNDTIYDINITESIDYIRNVYNTKIPEEDILIIEDVPNTNKYSIMPLIIILGVIIVKKEIYHYIYNY